jgi:hypothetical protein
VQRERSGTSAVVDFLTGGGFPAFGLSLLSFYELLLLGLVLTPGALPPCSPRSSRCSGGTRFDP